MLCLEQKYLQTIIKPVMKAISKGKDRGDIEDVLAEKFPNMPDKQFRQLCDRAMFTAKSLARVTESK
ncbi:MAG: hypothetical protein IKP67_02905 [Spirochaetales bacterium]|nr:hypothetical protein [Spirochaetales bacterium]